MFIHLQLKLRKRHGDTVHSTSLEDLCAVINLPGMLLWNVEVAFNNIEVSKIQPAQTYATYLRVLSEYRPALRSGLLNDLAIWMPDNPVRPEEFQSLELNKNHVSRAISLSNDGILEMYAPLMSDILLQPFLIPDNVSIRIDLVRNSHSFCLNVQPQANVIYELGILRADLCIKRHCENVNGRFAELLSSSPIAPGILVCSSFRAEPARCLHAFFMKLSFHLNSLQCKYARMHSMAIISETR